eukprot:TRINITY_DN2625_c0_g1_i2.p1 TRINITY_DN2625_c0_g1~~TRINITY_DN2625_c0_g1_i2.p1  ORF type:complete len:140 (-),score=24.87 TRINITY_DN2625_c0_g1_i2:9-407(-)
MSIPLDQPDFPQRAGTQAPWNGLGYINPDSHWQKTRQRADPRCVGFNDQWLRCLHRTQKIPNETEGTCTDEWQDLVECRHNVKQRAVYNKINIVYNVLTTEELKAFEANFAQNYWNNKTDLVSRIRIVQANQ